MLDFGSSPSTNSSDGVLPYPIGGGTLAPVEKIKTLLRLALESPSENMSLYKHIRLHSLRMLGGADDFEGGPQNLVTKKG